MNTRPFSPMSFFSALVWIVLVFIVSTIQISCNNNKDATSGLTLGGPSPKVDTPMWRNWAVLDVKFKEGTSEEIKDRSIKEIIKHITDTVDKIRLGQIPDFAPQISTIKNPWNKNSKISIEVQIFSKDTIGGSCPNPCQQSCGVCYMTKEYGISNPGNPQGPYSSIESITSPVSDRMYIQYKSK